ncbi:glycosyltransferase family 32 protein [Bacteroides hominis]|uniref:glycosyltransferase family 32 protein n=1 Tax=Bacteroides hominis TaxID=2763023 RepID=UPI003D6C11FB
MIPKTIHYCWFGRNSIPTEYQRYIETWKKHFPNYEIKEWNENNYDINCIPFSKEAYEVGKYAYVSDYARLRILYENGGVYFDTDVEVIKPMHDILQKGNYFAFEKNINQPIAAINVNPGLGFACEPRHPIIKEIMEFYETHHYIYPDGHREQIPIVPITTEVLKRHGLVTSNKPIEIEGNFTIYPWEYFCPMEYQSNQIEITSNTHTIHHYTATWMSWSDKLKMKKGYWAAKIKRLFSIK